MDDIRGYPYWLVVSTPPKNIGWSVGIMTFLDEWTDKTFSKPPSKNIETRRHVTLGDDSIYFSGSQKSTTSLVSCVSLRDHVFFGVSGFKHPAVDLQ